MTVATTDTCYICSGRGVIAVDSYDDDDEPYSFRSHCVRCCGDGTISDGLGRDELRRMQPQLQMMEPECICDFSRHGPLGDPDCPAR